MNMDTALKCLGICLLYHIDWDSAFTSFICEIVSMLHVHANDEIYVINLRYTMFNVHKVTSRYIRILPNFTIQQSVHLST